ncbi:MAG: redox-regulated ATPase YchF [Nitrospirae bacterium]|nr:redox-regulated ATPase YchF [Nitrospirota bacterium]
MLTGLIGLPLSGKTTIFNAVTGRQAATSQYAGGKKGMNIAEIEVPDPRVDALSDLFRPKRTTYAKVIVKDLQIAQDERGSIAPVSIAEFRSLAALLIVLRAFESDSVLHPSGHVDPAADLRRVVDSLIFSDYEVVEKRMGRLEKEAKKNSREYQILRDAAERLLGGRVIGEDFFSDGDVKLLSGLSLATTRPVIAVANTGEGAAGLTALESLTRDLGVPLFVVPGQLEMEIAQLEKSDQKEFLEDQGLKEPALSRFVQFIYARLNLISFLTVGPDEVRAWSIRKGSNAQKAAGQIHSDLEKGFIRAEVVSSSDLLHLKGLAEAKSAGKLRQEGKDYVVEDGDVLNILFNV